MWCMNKNCFGVFIFLSLLLHGLVLFARIPLRNTDEGQSIELVLSRQGSEAASSGPKANPSPSSPMKRKIKREASKPTKTVVIEKKRVLRKERNKQRTVAKKDHCLRPRPVPRKKKPKAEKVATAEPALRNVQEITHSATKLTNSSRASRGNAPKMTGAKAEKEADPWGTTSEKSLKGRYFHLIRKIIEDHKFYPYNARAFGRQGKVTVAFTIDHEGVITDIKIVRRCRYKVLDRAAMKTVLRSSPLPPPPKELAPPVRIRIEIVFTLEDS